MKTKLIYIFLLLNGLIFGNIFTKAQSRTSLEKRSKKLKNEIEKLNKQTDQNKKYTKEASSQLTLLSKKVKTRTKLLGVLEKEKIHIENLIYKNESNKNVLEKELFYLKKKYEETLIKNYKNKSVENKILWFLASENFLQIGKRLKYLEKYIFFQKQRAKKIHTKQKELNESIEKLKNNKKEKTLLLIQKEKENTILKKEKEEKDKLLSLLKKEKKKLINTIQKKQLQAKKLDNQIKDLIIKEIRIAREKALKAAKKPSTLNKIKKSTSTVFSKEEIQLSADFLHKKGSLPWPIKGILLSKFGKQAYPGLKEIYIENSGIEILTKKDISVKAVFDGTISKIYSLGSRSTILVQHGEYYTVYGNIEVVKVKKKEKVTSGQIIGEIGENSQKQKVLIFQLWHNTSKKDPNFWLKSL